MAIYGAGKIRSEQDSTSITNLAGGASIKTTIHTAAGTEILRGVAVRLEGGGATSRDSELTVNLAIQGSSAIESFDATSLIEDVDATPNVTIMRETSITATQTRARSGLNTVMIESDTVVHRLFNNDINPQSYTLYHRVDFEVV